MGIVTQMYNGKFRIASNNSKLFANHNTAKRGSAYLYEEKNKIL